MTNKKKKKTLLLKVLLQIKKKSKVSPKLATVNLKKEYKKQTNVKTR